MKKLLNMAACLSMIAGLVGCASFQEGPGSTTSTKPLAKIEYYGPTTSGHTLSHVLHISPRITKDGILIVDFGDVRVPASPPNDKMRYIHHFAYDPQTGILFSWIGKSTGKSPDVWNHYFYVVTDPKIERILNALASNPSSVTPCADSECGKIIQSAGGWDSIFAALVQPTKSQIYEANPIPYKSETQRVQDMWRMVVELFWSPAGVPLNPYNLKDGSQKPYFVMDSKKYKLGLRPDQGLFLYNFGQGSTRMDGNIILAQTAPEYLDEKNGGLTIKNWDAEAIALKLRSPQALDALKNLLKGNKK